MSIFSSLFAKKQSAKKVPPGHRLTLEALEDRFLPSCNVISGYVYNDVNKDGLYNTGDVPLSGVTVKLFNSSNIEVGSTTSNASGYYEFTNDATASSAPTTLTETVTFAETDTNFDLIGALDKFDSSLGTLQSIEFVHRGTILTTIRAENTSTQSPATVTGTVGGTLTLTGPGLNQPLTLGQDAGSLPLGVFDGNPDFGGTSGVTIPKTSIGSTTFTLTGAAALAPFIGTGTVDLHELGAADSTLSGGGNVLLGVITKGSAVVDVIYHYVPTDCLEPGNYTIVETQPTGFLDGQESKNGVKLNNATGVDTIPVTLAAADLGNNNFGELKKVPTSPPPCPPPTCPPKPPYCPPKQPPYCPPKPPYCPPRNDYRDSYDDFRQFDCTDRNDRNYRYKTPTRSYNTCDSRYRR